MTYKTHFVGGACAVALASTFTNVPIEQFIVMTGVGAASALIPDIDIEGSKANKAFGFLGKGLASVSNHRGFFHTPILYIVLSYLINIFSSTIAVGFLLGTMSHLVLDTFNYKGIMWFWPFTTKHYHIARIKTRTVAENIFMIAMIVITIAIFMYKKAFAVEQLSFENMENFASIFKEFLNF